MSTTQTRTQDHRHYSPSSSLTISGSVIVMCILAVAALISTAVSFLALGRVIVSEERAKLAERETRIALDDLKYVRAWLAARGHNIPISHEEAEEQ